MNTGTAARAAGMCAAAGASHDRCVQAHIYGMTEAERFGGKYIYFCPMGLTCFVSPILGEGGAEAKITVGPFIMVEKQDFIACELTENVRLTEAQKQAAVQVLENIPFVPTERVTQLSVLLFMARWVYEQCFGGKQDDGVGPFRGAAGADHFLYPGA